MRYRVEFEHNLPIKATLVRSSNKIINLTDFGEEAGKTCIKLLYVDAESEQDAIHQAERIVSTIFKF